MDCLDGVHQGDKPAYIDGIAKMQKTWPTNLNAISASPTGEAIAVGPKGQIVKINPAHVR